MALRIVDVNAILAATSLSSFAQKKDYCDNSDINYLVTNDLQFLLASLPPHLLHTGLLMSTAENALPLGWETHEPRVYEWTALANDQDPLNALMRKHALNTGRYI